MTHATRFPDDTYVVDVALLRAVEVLMKRLYSENRMSGDEMRDWGNKLHAMLESRVQRVSLAQLDEQLRGFP